MAHAFGGGVDADEYEICFIDSLVNVGGEKEVRWPIWRERIARGLDDWEEVWFVNGEGVGLPCCYPRLAEVDNCDSYVWIFARDY
jgi:hypothetical protein